jgi:PmbA protein
VAGSLLSPLLSALNGKTVFDGASPLKDKLGQKMLDSQFTFWDDPSIPFQPGSTPFDDEGIPAGKNALIKDGVINRFYYDLHTAALAGATSTGNGSRNGGMPSPSPHQLVVKGGETSPASMIKDIKEGIVIEMLMGADQGNILNGDFSGNVLLGYRIENGQVTGRVKDTMIHANVYDLLKEIVAVGNDARWIGGSVRVPSICCPVVSISSK